MSDQNKEPESANKPAAQKKSAVVTAEAGTTFAREFYAKGATISCTADQEAILKKHKVI